MSQTDWAHQLSALRLGFISTWMRFLGEIAHKINYAFFPCLTILILDSFSATWRGDQSSKHTVRRLCTWQRKHYILSELLLDWTGLSLHLAFLRGWVWTVRIHHWKANSPDKCGMTCHSCYMRPMSFEARTIKLCVLSPRNDHYIQRAAISDLWFVPQIIKTDKKLTMAKKVTIIARKLKPGIKKRKKL